MTMRARATENPAVSSRPPCPGGTTREREMKIEPVYLVAPVSKPVMHTRRAFLLAGGMFAAGTCVGGACGYSIGVARTPAATTPTQPGAGGPEPELPSSGDAQLDELRRFGRTASIDKLMDKAAQFLAAQSIDYRQDQYLWVGVDRISKEIITNPQRPVDYALIQVVIQNITFLQPPAELHLTDRIPQLQVRKEQERKRR